MHRVVISGYYGFGNAGDEAMLTAMIEALSELDPHIHITVISGNPEETRRRHGVHAVYRLNYWAIGQSLKQAQLLISGGGSLLQDVTSGRSIYYYLSIIWVAQKLRVPVMLYAQGIGPVRGEWARKAMTCLGNRVAGITVRDSGSLDELRNMGITCPKVSVTADPVLAMHPVDRQIGRSILKKHGQEGIAPLVGISVREWQDWAGFKTALAQAADQLVEEKGARIVFLPMQHPEDAQAAKKIVQQMRHPATVLSEEYRTMELMSLVGNCDLLIGIRLHALVFAAVMQVPLVGLSYDPKIDRFLDMMGETPVGSLATVTQEEIMTGVERVWSVSQKSTSSHDSRISELRAKAFSNAEIAMELMGKAGKKS